MKTVLVVDDEPSVLFALSEALGDRRRGVRVVTAANGVEAVAVLESAAVDLVLTDLRMPDMDGFELLAESVKGRVENISLASFLQLLEMERKTCTLSVRSSHPESGRQGRLYF